MARFIFEVQMVGDGTRLEHIVAVRWADPDTGEGGWKTRPEMVEWIRAGEVVWVKKGLMDNVRVEVVDASPPYIRTKADDELSDNLLALPRGEPVP